MTRPKPYVNIRATDERAMYTMTFLVDYELRQRIVAEADATGRSLADVMRSIMRDHFDREDA